MRQTSIFHIDVQKKLTSSFRVSVKPNMPFCCCIEMMLCISFCNVDASKKVRETKTSHTSQKTGNEVKCQSSKTLIFLFFCFVGLRREDVSAGQIQRIVNFQLGENLSQKLTVPLSRVTNQRRHMIYLSKKLFSCTRANWTKQRRRILVHLTSIYVVN